MATRTQTKVISPGPSRVHRWVNQVATYTLLIIFSIIFMIPFAWLLTSSFKQESQIFTWPPQWIPDPFWPQNYVQMFELVPMARFLMNTLKVAGLGTAGVIISSSLVGYGFARLRAPGLNILFGICLATLMLPSQVTIIPLFVTFSRFGWIDTHMPLWVPAWFGGGAFNIFLFRQFFASLPRELEDAAMIDGANRFDIFWRIILPNSLPVFAIVSVFTIQGYWSDIFNPVIYLNSREHYTLALGVTTLMGLTRTYFGPLMAASTLMTLPIIALYFFAQRYIAQGVMISGVNK